MDGLSINLYDESSRSRIEALQWTLGKRLLELDLIVIIEWGTWGQSERDALRLGARALGATAELHYLAVPPDVLFAAFSAEGRRNRRSNVRPCSGGRRHSKRRHKRR
jgi:hypothetical protein